MIQVKCPACAKPMGIEDDEPGTEWECPTCATPFVVQKGQDGSLQPMATTTPPAKQTGAIETETTRSKRSSFQRRRRNARLGDLPDAPAERDLDISMNRPAANPLQDRFPDMQPTNNTPSLFTINGIGFMFYGERDFDSFTGTYVKSVCLTVLFIPIFVMASYRVANAQPDGWHILGKVPLSTLAKGWNWSMLALVIAFVLLIVFSGG